MTSYTPIAELSNFIVLDKYTKDSMVSEPSVGYQPEAALERELIQDLRNQGYEYLPDITTPDALLAHTRKQLQEFNNTVFTDAEWQRFLNEYLDKPSDSIVDKTRKIHDNYIHDFVFDDGHIQNIYLVDKQNIARNKVQVINQFEQTGTQANRYDVTILVNGLPLVQIELKNGELQSARHLIRYTAIARKVLIAKVPYINICKCLSFPTEQIPAILPIQ